MVSPITPSQCTSERIFPDYVLEAFNHCIQKHLSGKRAIVHQNEVISQICERGKIARGDVFDNSFLDVEDVYRKAGWRVRYDKPGYNEDYEAFFEFIIP